MDEVAITLPLASVERSDPAVTLGSVRLPQMFALANCEVDEAKSPPWNQNGVVVACTLVPKLVRPVVKGHDPPPVLVGQVVMQVSPVRQRVVAVSAVVEANLN